MSKVISVKNGEKAALRGPCRRKETVKRVQPLRLRASCASLAGFVMALSCFLFQGCGSSESKPVDIFPEDICASCRMAISERAFASQIRTTTGEVYKFDDLRCLENFMQRAGKEAVAAAFVTDYATQRWLPLAQAIIVQTGMRTPMGSGRVAFADSLAARSLLARFPPGG
ncbi:MAG: nitrous oxide reductase accessory protein NosL [candidate division KSB1 bacterium]|nr:nitrous oxide reductase accessory protein NosL [candidate division KSB1 bacterium]MDZ7274211.1 nitrous oxide reductase accessory protein NosL [candidate division KSB1 bacterium]MDZ7287267.1 nitrous oxide reductase accessory protein NosL [candidate division KSB1 bacterium]MDZ7296809.1 nitrous oxide reductase accessory protein NosL [candidate division KSB1 bacterium]MDZ7308438.1 nitrous oxide reductase accessory protein NosL [candidate division KSB1 bacterium]